MLAIAGEKAVTDQNTVETEFTQEAWDKGYCDDEYVYNILDIDDGGTIYEDRYNILKDNGIDSESYNGYWDTANNWYDSIFINSAAYTDYEHYWNAYEDDYNKAIEAYEGGDYEGAIYYLDKATDDYMNAQSIISGAWKTYMDTTNPFSIDGIVDAVKSGKGFIAGGDAAYLRYSTASEIKEAHYNNGGYLGHAISLIGVVCNSNDEAVGFYIQDTGYGGDVSFITTEKLINFMTSGGTDYWNFITQMNVTKEEIRSWADAINLTGNKNNNVLTGNDANNVINGGAGNDTLIGKGGDDTLIGGAGNDLYIFGKNDGHDVIQLDDGEDSIQFYDIDEPDAVITLDKMEFSANEGNLVIKYNGVENAQGEIEYSSQITVQDYFKGTTHKLLTTVIDTIQSYLLEDYLRGKIQIDVDPTKPNDIYGTFLGDFIETGDYEDTIRGEAGNDTIIANGGNDLIYGGSGNDYLDGGNGDDTIYGDSYDENTPYDGEETANDTIIGGKGNDHIYTEAGNNVVIFRNGDNNDTVYVGTGIDVLVFNQTDTTIDDFVLAYDENDTDSLVIKYGDKDDSGNFTDSVTLKNYFKLNGEISVKSIVDANGQIYDLNSIIYTAGLTEIAGALNESNTITGSFLSETIIGGNRDEYIAAGDGNNIIDSGSGNDTIITGSGNDLIDAGSGNDYIKTSGGDNYINGGDGADTIYGGDGNDIIYGGKGNDYIEGGDSDDYLDGGDGDDTIVVGKGDDIVTGGKGNDYLVGTSGNNTFIFATGDGVDTIISGSGTDTLLFKDKLLSDLNIYSDEDNLIVKYSDNDYVIIQDYLKSDSESSIRNIIDSSGESYYLKNILDNVTIKTSETEPNDITGSYLDDLIYGGKQADTLRGSDGNDTIYGNEGNDLIYGDAGDDVLYGNEGNDTLYGGDGHDTIYGGKGNDSINAGKGENVIYFSVGDGNDTIVAGGGEDILVFSDFVFSKLKYYNSGNDLIIKYGTNYEDSVTVKDYFNSKVTNSVSRIEGLLSETDTTYESRSLDFIINNYTTVINIDGENDVNNSITGTSYNDSIIGGNMENTIKGAAGNDTLIGNSRKDLIYGGDGDDLIYGGSHYDTIYGGAGNDTIYGGAGNDVMYGDAGENHFYFEPVTIAYDHNEEEYNNNDTVYSGKGTDIFHFEGVEYSNLKFRHVGNDLVIEYGNPDANGNYNNSVTIANYFKLNGNVSVKTIYCWNSATNREEAFNLSSLLEDSSVSTVCPQNVNNKFTGSYIDDYIVGGNLADTIKGGKGNDTVYGGAGDDKLYGETGDDALYGGDGNDYLEGGDGDDILYGGNQNDTIKGGKGNDSIYSGAGDDKLYGNAGTNQFYIEEGDGNDTVYGGSGTDILNFTSIDFSAMTFIRDNGNLIIQYGNDSVTLYNYLKSKKTSIKTLVDKNNTEHSIQEEVIVDIKGNYHESNKITGTYIDDVITGGILKDTLNGGDGNDYIDSGDGNDYTNGGNGNDTLIGGNGNDTIRGGAGNDKIYGGYGNDKLYGDSGNDTFYFDNAANDLNGDDTVYSGSGYDILDISEVDFSNMKFTRNGNNLIIQYGTHETVTIYNYLANTKSSIKEIVTADQGNINIINDVTLDIDNSNSDKKLSIKGTFLNDSITGTDYDDTIYSGAGNDTVIGGTGNDKLYAQAGTSLFIFKSGGGNDTVYGGSGTDTLKFEGMNLGDLDFSRNNNDLLIKYGADSVTVNNYFNTNGVVSVKTIITEDNPNGKNLKEYWNSITEYNNITTTSEEKTVKGLSSEDKIDASAKPNAALIYGYGGNDSIIGSNHNDTIYGGTGDDTIRGGAGDDKLYGEGGTNTFKLALNDGKDTVFSGKGYDILDFKDTGLAQINSENGLFLQETVIT